MLLPLLALPFPSPLANLLVQGWLSIFCGLVVYFLLARYLCRTPVWPLGAAIGCAQMLIVSPSGVRFDWLVAQNQYAVSLTLLVTALLIKLQIHGRVRPWRFGMAVLLAIVANWVNFTASLTLLPLTVFLGLATAKSGGKDVSGPGLFRIVAQNSHAKDVVLVLFGALSGWLMLHVVKHHTIPLGFQPTGMWLKAWTQSATSIRETLGSQPAWKVAFCLAVVSLGAALLRKRVSWNWAVVVCLMGAALIWFLLASLPIWVQLNLFLIRYFLPGLFFVSAALGIAIADPISDWSAQRRARFIPVVCVLALLSTAWWRYGTGTPSGVRQDLIEKYGAQTEDILRSGANLVAGQYWAIWPEVFDANLILYERGEHRQVYGLSDRSGPTRKYWSAIPLTHLRVAVPADQVPDGQRWLNVYGLPLTKLAPWGSVDLFEYTATVRAAGR